MHQTPFCRALESYGRIWLPLLEGGEEINGSKPLTSRKTASLLSAILYVAYLQKTYFHDFKKFEYL